MPHRPRLGPGYVHPRAGHSQEHTYGLEVADESALNYQRWIAQLCRPYLGKRVLEIGAGYGAVTRFLSEGVMDYVASDTSPECLAVLESRFRDSKNVTIRKLDLLTDQLAGEFDAIILINVLEHLLDDSGVLRSLATQLAPDGRLIIYVPALNSLYGDWDDRIGHYRRYTRALLARVMRAAGLTVVDTRYVNLLAIPAWFAFSRLGVRRKRGLTAGIGRELKAWDRFAIPITRRMEMRVRPPVGLNVLGVAAVGDRAVLRP